MGKITPLKRREKGDEIDRKLTESPPASIFLLHLQGNNSWYHRRSNRKGSHQMSLLVATSSVKKHRVIEVLLLVDGVTLVAQVAVKLALSAWPSTNFTHATRTAHRTPSARLFLFEPPQQAFLSDTCAHLGAKHSGNSKTALSLVAQTRSRNFLQMLLVH